MCVEASICFIVNDVCLAVSDLQSSLFGLICCLQLHSMRKHAHLFAQINYMIRIYVARAASIIWGTVVTLWKALSY